MFLGLVDHNFQEIKEGRKVTKFCFWDQIVIPKRQSWDSPFLIELAEN